MLIFLPDSIPPWPPNRRRAQWVEKIFPIYCKSSRRKKKERSIIQAWPDQCAHLRNPFKFQKYLRKEVKMVTDRRLKAKWNVFVWNYLWRDDSKKVTGTAVKKCCKKAIFSLISSTFPGAKLRFKVKSAQILSPTAGSASNLPYKTEKETQTHNIATGEVLFQNVRTLIWPCLYFTNRSFRRIVSQYFFFFGDYEK